MNRWNALLSIRSSFIHVVSLVFMNLSRRLKRVSCLTSVRSPKTLLLFRDICIRTHKYTNIIVPIICFCICSCLTSIDNLIRGSYVCLDGIVLDLCLHCHFRMGLIFLILSADIVRIFSVSFPNLMKLMFEPSLMQVKSTSI